MKSRTSLTLVLLGLLVTAGCLPTPLDHHPPGAESPDKQLGFGSTVGAVALGLAAPTLTNLLTMGAVNLASAAYNFLVSTFSGARLELIDFEKMGDTPVRDPSTDHPFNAPPIKQPFTFPQGP